MKKQIVDIQTNREEQALKAYIEKKNQYEQYQKEYDALKTRLTEYQNWRVSETDRVFEELKKSPVTKKELDKIKEKLAEYKFEELALTEEEMKLAMQLKTHLENKEKSFTFYQESKIRKTKFEKVYNKQQTLAKTQRFKKEENEIDEDMILNFNYDN